MKYAIIDVRISELLTKQVSCVPWEVPILEAIHGGNVRLVGEEEIDREPPTPAEEYQRLNNKYRGNKEEDDSIVAKVYGSHQAGLARIAEEMRAAGIDVDRSERAGTARDLPAERSSRMSTGVRASRGKGSVSTLHTAGTPRRERAKPTPQPAVSPAQVAGVSTGSIEDRKAAARQARERFQQSSAPAVAARPR